MSWEMSISRDIAVLTEGQHLLLIIQREIQHPRRSGEEDRKDRESYVEP